MSQKRIFNSPYHPDVVLFLILIPFISAFNYYLTYTNVQLNAFLLLTFSIDTVQGYLAWWGVRAFILFLDKKWPYERAPLGRIALQLACTLIIGLTIITVLTELVSFIARGKPASLSFYTIDLFIISIWFFVINGIYVGLYYYNQWRNTEEKVREEQRMKAGGFVVKQGKQDLRLSFEELAGFFVDGEYAVACHISGKKYYVDQSLNDLEKNLPVSYFFRLNRQYMVHQQLVSGFRRTEDGKIMVMLKPHESFPNEIPVSRLKAPAFKRWFQPE